MTSDRRDRSRGFTLIEILVALSILALLATVAFPLTELASRREREQELRRALREIRAAIDAYKRDADAGKIAVNADRSGYPPTLDALVEGVDDATDLSGERKLYFLRRIPRDPMCGCPDELPEKTWALRSYESSPQDPREGDDVFDVASKSSLEALDGTHYKDW
ncbi:general secretion pathway protein GspG [Burkholderia ubonensis]|uniref:General secretion pathway protein GspG n=1 Tax=Burkholderia ubonensis TaxID=101571 RepID=A0AB73G053_9BURK|nr:type II secretion system protein [Burkholderia ubonensis]KVK78182.1 general secretion pathway protein GspG [Burkholderia ubonensis]KVL61870.1 general secretion pathway protein GspG [Burkholderia ubonensis]KVM28649.1 general secretion pathway protein GspG [Burkholderia ubonensis]KVM35159.1 general secretion pathway protein GspG [Burkholderia ubonensis]